MKKETAVIERTETLPAGFLFFLILPLLFFTACSNRENKKLKADFYYSRGEKIELAAPNDSMGVLLRHKMDTNMLKKRFQLLDYMYIRSLSEDVVIVIPAGNKKINKKEIITRSMELSAKDSQLIQKAGYVTYRKDGKSPVIITNDFMAEFKKGVSEKEINELLSKYEIQTLTQNPFLKTQYVLRATAYLQYDAVKACRLLAENSIVAYAHPNFIMVKKYQSINPGDNTHYRLQWYHENTGLERGTTDADADTDSAWNFSRGDSSTIIAIIDKGFDTTHPDLAPNFSYNPFEMRDGYNGRDDEDDNPFIDDILGWNFRGCTGENDQWGSHILEADAGVLAHGTAVMGMAVAVHNNIGVIGSCPECSVIPLQSGGTANEDAFAFGYAKQRGAKIISCSWQYTDDLIPDGIESPINDAFDSGITIFFAIDNSDGVHCEYPADISSLHSVIAISRSTNKDLFYCTDVNSPGYNSGYGNSMDLLAPGASDKGLDDFSSMWIATTDLQGNAGQNTLNFQGCGPTAITVTTDFLKCWDGTSFATPLTAGVGGLILSLDPTLRPKQVQYLLQDCADKIQPSFGDYFGKNGFSKPKSGIPSTHGYGRINAFEAVRIAAPRNNGTNRPGLGGMDIFLRDDSLDWGNTEQPSSTTFEARRGFIPFWKSQDIKVDAPPFSVGITADPLINTNTEFENVTDENPAGGVRNRVYVRIRNRGYKTIPSAIVKLHWTDACLGFPPLPSDFWENFPANATDITVWHPLAPIPITDLRYSGSSVAGSADDDGSQIIMFEFDAPVHDVTRTRNHYCLMALVSCPNDPIPTTQLINHPQKLNMDYVTANYNNATHRNYAIENAVVPFSGQFYIYNPYPYSITTRIETDSVNKNYFAFEDSLMTKGIRLKKGERRLVSVKINPHMLSAPAEINIQQILIGKKKGQKTVMGGFTYILRPPAKKPDK